MSEPAEPSSTEARGDRCIDAILFLPGMGEAATPQPIAGIAQRIARALDLEHQDEMRKFGTEKLPDLRYGQLQPREAEGSRVVELTDSKARAVYDVYKVDYRTVLYSEEGPRGLRANVLLTIALLSFLRRWLIAWLSPFRGLSLVKRIQLLLGGVLVFLATCTLLSLAVAGVSTLPWALVRFGSGSGVAELDGVLRQIHSSEIYSYMDGVYALLVALGGASLLTPTDVRKELDLLVGRMVSLQAYLENEHRREAVQAEVRNALEAIAEAPQGYRQIIIMGYSFGSIVALDATLLRRNCDPRIRKYVKTLVTIGCPATFISTYWRGFFRRPDRESQQEPHELRWINAYTPADVLGSQFKTYDPERSRQLQPDEEFAYPEPRKPGAGLRLSHAFASHSLYWEPDRPDQPAVFGPVVRALERDMAPDEPGA